MFARRELNLELFDESGHIAIADDGAFPFFDAENTLGDFYFHVAFDLGLTSKTPLLFYFLTGEVGAF